eukprot:scaffold39735_cov264-Isochrysis_galbana.AAC.5
MAGVGSTGGGRARGAVGGGSKSMNRRPTGSTSIENGSWAIWVPTSGRAAETAASTVARGRTALCCESHSPRHSAMEPARLPRARSRAAASCTRRRACTHVSASACKRERGEALQVGLPPEAPVFPPFSPPPMRVPALALAHVWLATCSHREESPMVATAHTLTSCGRRSSASRSTWLEERRSEPVPARRSRMRREDATSLRRSSPTPRSGCERETYWCDTSRELADRERGDASMGEVGGMCIDIGEDGDRSGESAPLRGDAGAIIDGWTAVAHCERGEGACCSN